MDPETQLAIEEGNRSVTESITHSFKEALAQAVKNIIDHIDLRVRPLEKDVERLRTDVSDLYEKDRDMRDRVSLLENRQSVDEGVRTGEGNADGRKHAKVNMSVGIVAVIIAAATSLGGLIGWLISLAGS